MLIHLFWPASDAALHRDASTGAREDRGEIILTVEISTKFAIISRSIAVKAMAISTVVTAGIAEMYIKSECKVAASVCVVCVDQRVFQQTMQQQQQRLQQAAASAAVA